MDVTMRCLFKACKTLAVKASGASIPFATSFTLNLTLSPAFEAIYTAARIAYLQDLEIITCPYLKLFDKSPFMEFLPALHETINPVIEAHLSAHARTLLLLLFGRLLQEHGNGYSPTGQ